MRLRTRQETALGIGESLTDAKVMHSQKSQFKANKNIALQNKADYIQGEAIDVKDFRKEERRESNRQKRKNRQCYNY